VPLFSFPDEVPIRWILGIAFCVCLLSGCGGGDNMRTDPKVDRGKGLESPSTELRNVQRLKQPPITPD